MRRLQHAALKVWRRAARGWAAQMSDSRHLEYARAAVARRDIEQALAMLQRARSEIAVLSGDHAKTVEQLDGAKLGGQRALEGIRRTIATMDRMWYR